MNWLICLCKACLQSETFTSLKNWLHWERQSLLGQQVLQMSNNQIPIFFFFLGPYTCSIWKFPGEESNWSCRCWPTPQPWQCQI